MQHDNNLGIPSCATERPRSMIKWTPELNVNEGPERKGEGVRGTSVPCCLGLNCQPKAKEAGSLSFSEPTPWGSLSSIELCGGPPYNHKRGNYGIK